MKKKKLLDESIIENFIFTLFDIRREHNSDYPARERDREHDYPSCPGGVFGRMIFRLCPLQAVTTLNSVVSVEDIENAAKQDALSFVEKVNCATIPQEVENFIIQELESASNDVKKSVYSCFTTFMNGGIQESDEEEKNNDPSVQAKQKYEQDQAVYQQFLNSLNPAKLITFLEAQIKGLTLHSNDDNLINQASILQIFEKIKSDMEAKTLFQKNYVDVYANPEDRNFIVRLRKEGAKILQSEGLTEMVEKNEELLSLKQQVRELAYSYVAIKEMTNLHRTIENDVIYIGSPSCWAENFVNVAHSYLSAERERELTLLKAQMDRCYSADLKNNIATEVVKQLFSGINSFKVRSLQEIKSIIDLLTPCFEDLPSRICSDPAKVAHQLIHIAFKRTLSDEKIAIFNWFKEHINNKNPSGVLFLSVLREIEIQELNEQLSFGIEWIDRKEAIRFLQKQFSADGLNLGFHALVDLNDMTQIGDALLGQAKEEVFAAAGQDLVLATAAGATPAQTIAEHYKTWMQTAVKLAGISDEPNKGIITDLQNPAIKKLMHLVVLTLCRNLALTSIRQEDKKSLEALCLLYLTKENQSSAQGGGPMFDLVQNDKLSTRLHYLAVHLACLTTTLKPISALFNTGHVRIMDRASATAILNTPAFGR